MPDKKEIARDAAKKNENEVIEIDPGKTVKVELLAGQVGLILNELQKIPIPYIQISPIVDILEEAILTAKKQEAKK